MNQRSKFTITLLSTAHLVLDSYSSFIFPLLPLLAVKLALKPAQIGMLTPTLMITSSLMQPVYGMLSDRYLKRSMAVFGPLIAAVFLSCIGLATSLPMLLAIVICGGIGIGSFHPQGAAIVARAAAAEGGKHQGMVMSVFSSTGTVGYALGPLIIALVVSRFGLEHSWYTLGWGLLMWALMFKYCPPLEQVTRHADAPSLRMALRAVWVPLTLLYFAVVLRSAVSVSVQTFLPFALKDSGLTTTQVSWVLAGFLFFGGLGGFFGGALADRLGARRVSLVSMLLATPLLLAAFSAAGPARYGLLLAGGTLLNLPIPISVVMAQRLVPGGASTVSALVMGFAWGAGALLAPVTGYLSEHVGFIQALTVMSTLPLVSALLLWFYPKDAARAVASQAQEALAMGD
ncbi:MAG: MFS transporter [Acidobacteria bacterium]|nr:MFS transporter [Acidobacteriota bacterium]